MGRIVKQSFTNLVVTYIGFAFGALNTLLLYPRIVPDTYYGWVLFILASGTLIMPVMAFGVPQTLIRFYSRYQDTEKDRFLTLMVLLPLLGSSFVVLGVFCFQESLVALLSDVNPVLQDYLWYGVGIGLAMAYFEVFYAWCRAHLQSVFGNFMKEVFGRVGVSVLLLLLYAEVFALDVFLKALVGLYVLRTLLLKLYAYRLYRPAFTIEFPSHIRNILRYAFLILLGGSAALVLLEVDKVMLNQFTAIEHVAYYGVAVYIATVIAVPSRAMRQITYPLTAKLVHANQSSALKRLYQKTSLTLFIASGLFFLLIILNLEEVYQLLPEAYRQGGTVVFVIGLAKVCDAMLGNNNALLYNSKHYTAALIFSIGFAALTIALNALLIPRLGLEGAALASCSALVGFSLVKLYFVQATLGFFPFTKATAKVFVILIVLGLLFYGVSFPFHPLLNIALQSVLITGLYVGLLHYFTISEEVSGLLSRVLTRKNL